MTWMQYESTWSELDKGTLQHKHSWFLWLNSCLNCSRELSHFHLTKSWTKWKPSKVCSTLLVENSHKRACGDFKIQLLALPKSNFRHRWAGKICRGELLIEFELRNFSTLLAGVSCRLPLLRLMMLLRVYFWSIVAITKNLLFNYELLQQMVWKCNRMHWNMLGVDWKTTKANTFRDFNGSQFVWFIQNVVWWTIAFVWY